MAESSSIKKNTSVMEGIFADTVDNELPREYKTEFEYRGKAIIANIIANQRKNEENLKNGAEKDVRKLKETFELLQFKVKVMNGDEIANKNAFLKALKKVAEDGHHEKSECFVLVVLGLVRKGRMLYVYDEELQVNEVWEIFTNDKCVPLAGKPKLFFFQAFWWDESLPGSYEDSGSLPGPPMKKYSIPVESDIHIMYPTVEDAVAMGENGSPFISGLCSVLKEDWFRDDDHKEPLQNLMTYLCKRVDVDPRRGIVKEIPVIGSTLLRLVYFRMKFSFGDEEPTEESEKTEEDEQREYNRNYEFRGKAIIANFYISKIGNDTDERLGSREDVKIVKKTFQKLQFNVDEENIWDEEEVMTAKWFDEKLRDVAKDHDGFLKKSECFVLVVMCHGGSNGCLRAFDEEFQLRNIWEKFTAKNCPSLEGKPKFFFFQACRGENLSKQTKIHFDIEASIPTEQYWIPDEKDILIMYPTFEDNKAFRGTEGSPFILSLCKVLNAEGENEPIQILMTNVCREVAQQTWKVVKRIKNIINLEFVKQMPTVISTLQKLLYFRRKF